ncbi:MAG: mechanosensitive ion channel family protein [Desulfurococcaceae archaeon]
MDLSVLAEMQATIVRLLEALAVFVAFYLAGKYVGRLVQRLVGAGRVAEELSLILRGLIYAIGALAAVSIVSVEPLVFSALLLLLGLGAIATFFDVLRNLGAELYARSMGVARVGDVVEVEGIQGRVVRAGPLGMVVERVDGSRAFIPFSKLATAIALNRSTRLSASLRATARVQAQAREEAERLLGEALEEHRPDMAFDPLVSYVGQRGGLHEFEITLFVLNPAKIPFVLEGLRASLRRRAPGSELEA